VARNLREFVDDVHMMGLAGEGPNADRLHGLLHAAGIHMDCVQIDPMYQTICKTRIIARHQQVVRVDRERPTPFTPAQTGRALAQFEALVPSLDAVILEDYAKGLLEQPLIDEIIRLSRGAGKIIAVDPNPSNRVTWYGVTTVTPNRAEAFRSAELPWVDPVDPPMQDRALLAVGKTLLEKWGCSYLLITLSEQGMMLFEPGRPPFHIPTRAQEVFDVSGAGDTAIALFTAALAGGAAPIEAAEISNHASGIVVGKLGTATVTRQELLASFSE
jgi:D-beta-D-heptose 7-phosphate kinase/D-beta-D-heptose 1-phosphate adenosyltransferase